MAYGYKESKGLQSGRRHKIEAESQLQGAGLALGTHATKNLVGFLGPGANLARRPLLSSEGKSSPHSLLAPLIWN